MAAAESSSTPLVLEKLDQLIEAKTGKKTAEQLKTFARECYSRVAEEDLVGRSIEDLFAAIYSLWKFCQKFNEVCQVRVFNPELKNDGWTSPYTVIQLLHKDIPFLVDSLRMELNRQGINTHLHVHVPMAIVRGKNGNILQVNPEDRSKATMETPMLIEIDRQFEGMRLQEIEGALEKVLADVRATVDDWQPMKKRLGKIIKDLENDPPKLAADRIEESLSFLRWIHNDHFILMGYRRYELVKQDSGLWLKSIAGSGMGIMRDDSLHRGYSMSKMPEGAKKLALATHNPLIITKTSSVSTVHRPSHIDYVGIKRFDDEGHAIGEHRFLGLFTSAAYNLDPMQIPVMREKILRIMDESGFLKGSHDYKALKNVLETYPRDELMQISTSELKENAVGILHLRERKIVKAFVRKDPFGRHFSCLVYVPRDIYNTQLRLRFNRILAETFKATGEIRFTTFFSESNLVRIHFIVPVANAEAIDLNMDGLQKALRTAARSWRDQLAEALMLNRDPAEGARLVQRYGKAFPASYRGEAKPGQAVADIEIMETLSEEQPLGMSLYRRVQDESSELRFKLYHYQTTNPLSDVLPMLENMGLRVIAETPFQLQMDDGDKCFMSDFLLRHEGKIDLDPEAVRDIYHEAFARVWTGDAENDGFNRLVLAASLDWRQTAVMRAYAKYIWQIGSTFSQNYIEETLAAWPEVVGQLLELFACKFDPDRKFSKIAYGRIKKKIQALLNSVSSLDQDRILHRYMDLIDATVRTNFYQPDEDGNSKSYISLKLLPTLIPDMPRPMPMFEIFVYSPRVEGVHLRGGKVARGGLRWSDRREDFRTEVLGLVKAQQVKNSVIVPVGAKGGFVCKQLPTEGGREAFFAEGIECYKTFIRGLLDITDNYDGDKLVHPRQVVYHDEPDPYLVVAADKGTATFSDIANGISEDYGFWLRDAFASGGSQGYDHKRMGITARGAWESVKRHFREMGIDCQSTDFTVLGIGDMGGDVFGNGMLCSKHIRLQAAFNHLHIFLDPNPDAARSYEERERLFQLPRSSWEDYNEKLVSKGGGVFSRAAKSISLSPQVQKMLGVKRESMAPNELIRNLLRMEVDLLWNGGIGTYVKASSESNAQVGDRANDGLRVNGNELRCKVIGEGGNLGFTQLGRVEYMRNGGRGNTDFIDNAGGVNCSDNEVNIKILLNSQVDQGNLTMAARNKQLAAMTEEVADIVLADNDAQARSISITKAKAKGMVKEHIRFINYLEKEGKLDREIEFLPSDEDLQERKLKGEGLTRAEIAVLLAYGKMDLKEKLLIPEVVENSYFDRQLVRYFPAPLRKKYRSAMDEHRLKPEIIAMGLANDMVNYMGANFAYRVVDEIGATIVEVAHCFSMAKEIFGMEELWAEIDALDNKVPAEVQTEMMFQSRRMIRRTTRWFIRNRPKDLALEDTIAFYRDGVEQLRKHITKVMDAREAKELEQDAKEFREQGVPRELAFRTAYLSTMFSALDIVEMAKHADLPIPLVAEVYYKLGVAADLHWFLWQIVKQPVENHWQAFARAAFREELDFQQRNLTEAVLAVTNDCKNAEERIKTWISRNESNLQRWRQVVADFRTGSSHEFAKFSVALRELLILVQRSQSAADIGRSAVRRKPRPRVRPPAKSKA